MKVLKVEKAVAIKVLYQSGTRMSVSGVKMHSKDYYNEFESFRNTGHGIGIYTTRAELTLAVRMGETGALVDIAGAIKNALGRRKFSEKLIEAIRKTMPSEVEVEEVEGDCGKKFFQLTDNSINKWAKSIKAIP